MTAIIALLIELAVFVQPRTPAQAPEHVRPIVADGSVWGDVVRDGEVRLTERLCDDDAHTRWLVADVDGDGSEDLISFRIDVFSSHLDVWHQGVHGFVHTLAAPRQLVHPLLQALHAAVAALLSFTAPSV